MEIAMKAFVYYHGYCISLNGTKRCAPIELLGTICMAPKGTYLVAKHGYAIHRKVR